MWEIFHCSVHEVACSHYSPQQLCAWSPGVYPGAAWESRIENNQPFVAEVNGIAIAYADIQPSGYIDQFFVASQAVGKGVGAALMRQLEHWAIENGMRRIYANVSLSAQPFFTRCGFKIEAEQEVTIGKISLRNARMYKDIGLPPKFSHMAS